MLTDKKTVGNFGEDAACKLLEDNGYKVIKRNFYCRAGEIDIIATDGEYTVFVEVKTRKNADFGTAAEFVDWRKQEKIKKTALEYAGGDIAMRFDVIEVYYHKEGSELKLDKIEHIPNAF